ncbi:hypothetical protein [Cryobacterium sp. PH31-O1]|uniref:hypothetical protein n=1 Tax=Cryobacterium sp. PH31-O1 TaxID=3046306 RepID=UPI0024BB660C|nr:hypothetical protein [Cryobacterium sp. PH31-O1]MDJ0338263.1 hypothetical protein [Cryobacterium sp. PH31-O1]
MAKAEFFVDGGVTRKKDKRRARVGVYTGNLAAMSAEARHRTLTRALDAGAS